MSKLFVLSDPAIKRIRKDHPVLRGKKLIGTGQFSGVFEGSSPNTVLKLSIDRASYVFHTSYLLGNKNKHFSRLINDYGIVGHFVTSKNVTRTAASNPRELNAPIYLYEVEKLHKTTSKTENRLLSTRISRDWRKFSYKAKQLNLGVFSQSVDAVSEIEKQTYMTGQRHIIDAMFCLAYFLKDYSDAFIDIHGANIMQRENGDFVFSDPVGDQFIYDSHYSFNAIEKLSSEDLEDAEKRLLLAS